MESSLGVGFLIGMILVGLTRYEHYRWQEAVDRERFVLALKAASTPERLAPGERSRLRLLRTPWWAVWRWLPERVRDARNPHSV